ncbi:MAG: hypothetical protein GF365_01765 [Candidatus Buchananbacteria bacterium]|nr:hypothetical protein [Candidatus Buchananbacteria bacterium]
MKKTFLILLILIIGLFLVFNSALAFQFGDIQGFYSQTASKTGLSQTDPGQIVAEVIQAALTLVGALLVILMVYGGITWMTAGGNEEKVGKAKKTIIYSIIGVLVIIGSYSITFFISSTIEDVEQEGETASPGATGQGCADLGGVCETLYSCSQKNGNILNVCAGGELDGVTCTYDGDCPGGNCNDFGCTGQICCQVPDKPDETE